ncbi:MAG: Gx transporter family protein, partial [Lachnospiraceae bacterium]|nr:Gx transporter family protein [Lachnospiraceae bacterium]
GSFSITAVSVAGGVCHNIGQLAASCVMIGMPILNYLPVLIISGAVSGALVGVITTLTLRHLRSSVVEE